ncbi:MarR family winged helix-turn-helix transcriptional regulator [Amycolatopsis circi]|uniref:MarR family winged helix-turn-helix transcriptional regulator n=1 Tax=Amycolatopsis circi TaxID=871959 RepID=UPI000E251C35|nr:MarR family transcriptional regulator [Amycolatopsis circi]
MERDFVDDVLDQWRAQRPDLDPAPLSVLARLTRIARRVTRRLDETLKGYGVLHADLDILATLRRAGAPYELTLSEIARWMLAGNSTMTSRLDRLVAAGLVDRKQNPANRRTALIRLTPAGLALVDEAVAVELAEQEKLVSGLSGEDQRELADLLRRLCRSMGEIPD